MRFREIADELKKNVPGTKAILWIGPDGALLDYTRADRTFDVTAFAAEYSTLLAIARRASEDTAGGEIREHILISETSLTAVRWFDGGHFLILTCAAGEPVGRIRWELKRATRHMADS